MKYAALSDIYKGWCIMKKLRNFLCVFLAATLLVLTPLSAKANRKGDADGDGTITAADARLCLRCAVGLEEYSKGSAEFSACDVTNDGSVTAEDARLILRAAVGLESISDLPYSIVSIADAKVGDVILFGAYEQDGNDANGREQLEWLVLAKDGNTLTLITLYAVEQMQFHNSLSKVTWETSSLRAWLNDTFLNTAFTSSEKEHVLMNEVIAEKNPEYPNSPAGNDTEDKVFLLSVQEAKLYFSDNAYRKCSPTEKLVATGKFTQSNKPWYAKHNYACNWWLRSPGMFRDNYVSYVDKGGGITGGGQVNYPSCDICVRPVIRINVK